MIPLNDEFYEDEVREGFYVPAEMKQAWGAQITVLNEIDRVCKKHGIRYYACWGTLLGAIRHGGIIPWDDDFDIAMLREDYEKFMSVWKEELPKDYDVINYKTHPNHIYFVSNVVAKSRICFEQEHLEQFHGFPYISGVDIFVFDNILPDEEKERQRMKITDLILKIADELFADRLTGIEAAKSIRKVEEWCGVKVPKNLKGVELRIYLYSIAEKLFSNVSNENSTKITQVISYGLWGRRYVFDREEFVPVVELPFEGGNIPVSRIYLEQITKSYRNYKIINKNRGIHAYPYYDKQRESLQQVLDFELPAYKVTKDEIGKREYVNKNDTYKSLALEMTEYITGFGDKLEGTLHGKVQDEGQELLSILADMQQAVIELGTFIEQVKGEGYITVTRLEGLCDLIYEYGSKPGKELLEKIKQVLEQVRTDINCRKEIVFMPFKAKYWDAMKTEYNKVCSDSNNDVYVVPLPYYYKKYDGSLRDMQYDFDSYPTDLKACRCDEFNIEIHCPDVIVIQNPYDEYNATTSVPPYFYSSNLVKYTDCLIYIPWFKTEEFDNQDKRSYKNMRYYVEMPGVVNADKVYVQSDNIKDKYISRLCDFAGEETNNIWKTKILVQE